ncbi:MAG: hypothetical protein DDT34_00192 [Firmicutes bacterium]|nr:hypothetical protein [Bacillota bacterium]
MMWLPLDELGNLNGAREYTVILPPLPLTSQGDAFIPTVPTQVDFVLVRSGEKIDILGRIQGRGVVSCARCLSPTEFALNCDYADAWWPFGQGEESEDFLVSAFVDSSRRMINLELYATEMVLAHLPMRAWCSPDCQGMCAFCGKNLNEAECKCAMRDVDPRLAVLGRLLNDKGGVLDGTTKEKNFKGSPR